jgi:hypothetical protein
MDTERLQQLIFRQIPKSLSTYNIGPGAVIYSPIGYGGGSAQITVKGDKCDVDVSAEVFMRKGTPEWRDYSDFLRDYLDEHDTEDALEKGSDLFLTNWFNNNAGPAARRIGCKVDEVHVHGGPAYYGPHTEHVHIKCREKVPCGLAVKGAIEVLQTVKLLK